MSDNTALTRQELVHVYGHDPDFIIGLIINTSRKITVYVHIADNFGNRLHRSGYIPVGIQSYREENQDKDYHHNAAFDNHGSIKPGENCILIDIYQKFPFGAVDGHTQNKSLLSLFVDISTETIRGILNDAIDKIVSVNTVNLGNMLAFKRAFLPEQDLVFTVQQEKITVVRYENTVI